MKPTHAARMLGIAGLAALMLAACSGSDEPGATGHYPDQTGLEYAPDMYHSLPPEPYSQMTYNEVNPDGKNLRQPPTHTIARGKLRFEYPYPNTNEGYEAAGRELRNPLPNTPEVLEEGKRLYTYYCTHCHGDAGNGQGKISANATPPGPFAGVPSYYDDAHKNLPEGKMFHSITYGKNLMGSHASQLTPNQRWMVVRYVQLLQRNGLGGPEAASAAADSVAGSMARKTAPQTGSTGANTQQSLVN